MVLRERFASYGHFPSEDHWKGLAAVAQAIEDMAEGRAECEYSYSSLATGMGKTSVLLEAIRQMRKDPAYAEVGIVVFCSRLDQIERMIAELNLPRVEFAVETGQANMDLNQRGRGRFNRNGKWVSEHQQAPILFTTQAKLLTVVALRFSDEFESFWRFNNRPRQVRVWDEAVMPAKPLVLTPNQILELASQLDLLRESRAADELRAVTAELQEAAAANGKTFGLPSFEWFWSIESPEAIPLFDELDSPGNILFRMAGRLVRLFRDPSSSAGDGTTITYRELLPKDLAPMLILDASGDLRVTYKACRRHTSSEQTNLHSAGVSIARRFGDGLGKGTFPNQSASVRVWLRGPWPLSGNSKVIEKLVAITEGEEPPVVRPALRPELGSHLARLAVSN
jgi:hypothetical protein